MLRMPITQLPGRPLQPTGVAAAERKGPCEAQGNLPGGPSNPPDPEWAGWGTSIILCRAGMWKPEPSPLVWQVGVHSPDVEGARQTPDLSGRSARSEEGARPPHPQAPDPLLPPPLPQPETRELASKLKSDASVREHWLS